MDEFPDNVPKVCKKATPCAYGTVEGCTLGEICGNWANINYILEILCLRTAIGSSWAKKWRMLCLQIP
ncbi:MAG: hypothetical protein ACRCY4_04990, partial [Brevinema sp.]